MDLTLFSIQKTLLFMLVLARTAAIFTLTPIFGATQTPRHVRVAVALAITVVFVPMVSSSDELPVDMFSLGAMILREVCVGLVIGFVCTVVFAAIQTAGDLVDAQSGFGFASMVDPINGTQTAVAGRFQHLLAGLLFFSTNAHHLLIRGMADSFALAPVGQLAMNPTIAGGMMDLFVGLFAISVRIAVPMIAAVFLADVALAITARIVPQMNVFIVGLPLKLGVGIATMLIALPMLASMTQGMFGDMSREIGSAVSLLSGP